MGMSTVPEVIVARHMEMKFFGLSVITVTGGEDNIETVSLDEVLEAAKKVEFVVRSLIKELTLNC